MMNADDDVPLSVVMLVYNGEKFIYEAIQSILNQTFKEFELLIIDDGSNDQSSTIIKSFNDPRIRELRNEKNEGLLYSRNRGIEEARGKFMALLDCDDIALPDRFEKQITFLEMNPDYGMVGSWYYVIDTNGKLLMCPRLESEDIGIRVAFFLMNHFAQSAIMIRTNLIQELKYRPGYAPSEDYDLWWRVLQQTKVFNIPQYLIKYREHSTNISKMQVEKSESAAKQVLFNNISSFFTLNKKELDVHFYFFHDVSKLQLSNYKTFFEVLKLERTIKKILCTEFGTIAVNRIFNKHYTLSLRGIFKNQKTPLIKAYSFLLLLLNMKFIFIITIQRNIDKFRYYIHN